MTALVSAHDMVCTSTIGRDAPLLHKSTTPCITSKAKINVSATSRDDDMATSLGSCVASLRSTTALLSSSITILDSGVSDFPRLGTVLQTTRHFELLPESHIHSARAALLASLDPEIAGLLARVERHLDRLRRREMALVARTDLLEGRLGEAVERRADSGATSSIGVLTGNGVTGGGGVVREKSKVNGNGTAAAAAARLKQLRRKRQGLEYAVERLHLQAQQRQRQLRMSVAAQ